MHKNHKKSVYPKKPLLGFSHHVMLANLHDAPRDLTHLVYNDKVHGL
jgi:hypothetical protein